MNTETAEKQNKIMYISQAENFSKIPGSPISYWVGKSIYNMFDGFLLKDRADFRSGMSTTDNERFLRFWYEVSFNHVYLISTSLEEAKDTCCKWFPYNKGGNFRRWYGNNELLVNWFNDGEEIKYWVTHNPKDPKTTSWSRRIFATDRFFQKGITWTSITTGLFSCRCYGVGFIFDSGANGCFVNDDEDYYLVAAYCNSKVFSEILKIINPTINNGPGTIGKMPMPITQDNNMIGRLTKENITASKSDWDSFETSWDFKKHPLI